jgi:hypothetical protein
MAVCVSHFPSLYYGAEGLKGKFWIFHELTVLFSHSISPNTERIGQTFFYSVIFFIWD